MCVFCTSIFYFCIHLFTNNEYISTILFLEEDMCGIIGCSASENILPLVMDGLVRLEYRGYDSSGIAAIKNYEIKTVKSVGRVQNLLQKTANLTANTAIGHTRWATHGKATLNNCHPHLSMSKSIAVVHNGIIENYGQIKDFLIERGFEFYSDTDSEVIAKLIEYYYCGDIKTAIIKATRRLIGSFAIGVIHNESNSIFGMRRENPLIIGLSTNKNFIASDMPALSPITNSFILPENDELIELSDNFVNIYNSNLEKVTKQVKQVNFSNKSMEKGGLSHYMLKEIYEQPSAVKDTITQYLDKEKLSLPITSKYNRINIVACGSAYHAGLMGKYFIEKQAKIPVDVQLGSEFRYKQPLLYDDSITIAISQSGETADTIAAILQAKRLGQPVYSIVNVPQSSLTRATTPIYTKAGQEIAVATTKGFVTQVITCYLIGISKLQSTDICTENSHTVQSKLLQDADSIQSSQNKNLFLSQIATNTNNSSHSIDNTQNKLNASQNLIAQIENLPELISNCFERSEEIKRIASRFCTAPYMFFIGRGEDYYAALEGALKLKEIAYIFTQAYASGELKHGSISLITKGTPVVALVNDQLTAHKTLSNIIEVKARGGIIITFSCLNDKKLIEASDYFVSVPACEFSPLLSVVELQLFAYYTALAKGCDIDKPRNLAKSVTVE